jgi:hypothetical protein
MNNRDNADILPPPNLIESYEKPHISKKHEQGINTRINLQKGF